MNHDQFTLPFLDTTIVAEGFGLYGGFPTAKSSAHAQINSSRKRPNSSTRRSHPTISSGAGLPARRRSPSCRGLESARRGQSRRDPTYDDDRGGSPHARPDEQERLARFTAFGASDLADRIFRRAGDALRPPGKISASNSKGSSRATTSPTSSGPPNTPTTRRSS